VSTSSTEKTEVYFSTDVETDGPTPGLNAMLSLGSAAYAETGELLGTFSVNLETLPESAPDPIVSRWWKTQAQAYAACREKPEPATVAMPRFAKWVLATAGNCRPIFVAWPVSFDFPFVAYYLNRFAECNVFGFKAIDIQSLAMGVLAEPRLGTVIKDHLPRSWIPNRAHTHVALEDALEQGELFLSIQRAICCERNTA
jgi:hypothetical protein